MLPEPTSKSFTTKLLQSITRETKQVSKLQKFLW